MPSLGEMIVEIGIDSRALQRGLDQVRDTIDNASSKLSRIGEGMKDIGGKLTAGLTLPIVGAGIASVKLASDFEESLNKVDVAFKDNAKEVKDWSNITLKSFGIAQGTALDMAALFGDMATGMGLNTDEASKMSKQLVGLAGDLSSFKNIKIDVAETALKSIFTGETESLKNLGIVMTQANLEAWALSKGMKANIKDMTEAEKVQLRYAFVMDKTKNAQGDFARTQGGAANQMRIFQESLKQLGQQLGAVILPIVTKIITRVNKLVSSFSNLSPTVKRVVVIGAGLLAVLGPLFMIVGSIASGISALIPIIAAISLPMLGWVAAIVAVIAGLVLLWRNNEDFRNKVKEIWTNIWNFLKATFESIKAFAIQVWESLKQFWASNGEEITNNLMMIWNSLYEFLSTTFSAIFEIAKVIFGAFKVFWNTFGETILENTKNAFTALSNVISGAFEIINGILKVFIGLFTGEWRTFWDGIKSIASGVVKVVKGVIGGMIDKIKGAINIFKKAKSLFGGADDEGKKATSKLQEGGKAKVPALANGGVITRPTLAMIGEGGESEAVIPLSKLDKMTGKGGVTVNVTGNNIQDTMDVDIIAEKIVNKLKFAGVY